MRVTRRPKITITELPAETARECSKLKWWRQHVKGMTQGALASALGYTCENTIAMYERGYRRENGKNVPVSKYSMRRFKDRCAQLDNVAPDQFNWGIK